MSNNFEISNETNNLEDENNFTNLKQIAHQTNPHINSLNDLKSKINELNIKKSKNGTNYSSKEVLIINDTNSNLTTDFQTKFKAIRFIIISAIKLKLEDLTLATASVIFHKFFKTTNLTDFDPYLIATASIYLASKVEEQDIKLRDIINVCYRTLHPYMDPLEIGDKYWSIRKSVIQIELLIVRVLSFKLEFDHPHKYLLIYLDSLRNWIPLETRKISPVPETSWHMLRDLLHSDLFLKYRPQDIAISIIYFVCICYGVKIPYNDLAQKSWWKALDDKISKSCIHEIIEEILTIYELEDRIGEIKFD